MFSDPDPEPEPEPEPEPVVDAADTKPYTLLYDPCPADLNSACSEVGSWCSQEPLCVRGWDTTALVCTDADPIYMELSCECMGDLWLCDMIDLRPTTTTCDTCA